METDLTITTEEMRGKLRTLESHLPGKSPALYDFAAYLADKLERSPELVPGGFCMLIEQALFELREGKPVREVPATLTDRYAHSFLRIQSSAIARAVCPQEFANAVIDIYREMLHP